MVILIAWLNAAAKFSDSDVRSRQNDFGFPPCPPSLALIQQTDQTKDNFIFKEGFKA
jgi:hypothetical protein